MFETLLNFVAGVIFGTIFVLMILFFMMCILWCRPVPRVPIAKNAPSNKIANEVEETTKWISIFTNNEYFHNWLQLKLSSSIQSEIETLKNSDESISNINFKINKTTLPNIALDTVKTEDTVEGTAISSFPISFSSNIKIETEITINSNNDTNKKVKSVAIVSSSQPIFRITIPYEKGIILIELLLGLDAQINFEDDIITEEIKEADGKIQEKESNLSAQEEIQVKEFKKTLSQFLNHASFKIDVDTVPIEEQTKDIITETDPNEIEKANLTKEGETSTLTKNLETEKTTQNKPNIDSKEDENKKESEEKNEVESEDKNEVESEEKNEVESEDKNDVESEDKNDDDDDDDKNEDDDDDDDDEYDYSTSKIKPMRREFVVDQEIQEIVDQATSLINDKTTTTTTTVTTNPTSEQKP